MTYKTFYIHFYKQQSLIKQRLLKKQLNHKKYLKGLIRINSNNGICILDNDKDIFNVKLKKKMHSRNQSFTHEKLRGLKVHLIKVADNVMKVFNV
jgi:hypothetical protein